jgi:hypothetical protein
MLLTNLLKYRKLASASREDLLSGLIRRYLAGKLSSIELENELERLYSTGSQAASILGSNPLYRQVHSLITEKYPVRGDIRPDQAESHANTVSARAVTQERLSEYASRGTQMVKVVAYLDDATTEICRMMHGRIFEIGPASERIDGQELLVQPANFWVNNQNFSQSPSSDMEPWLPPYHYNCRTRIVPYIEPSDPYEASMDRYNNLIPLREKDVETIISKASKFEFATREKLFEHVSDHKEQLGISTHKEYLSLVSNLLQNPLKQMGIAISARDRSLNLYVWNPKVRMVGNSQMHDFAVFSLDKNTLKTFHPKSSEDIIKNLDPTVHGKVMLLSQQKITKGVSMVGEYDVYCYELILSYFKTDDSTDEQEMFSRLRFDKEWDSIPESFKQRILAVDKVVLEKYADWFNYNVFNDYIACIKARLKTEGIL